MIIEDLLNMASEMKASDLHISPGKIPRIRVQGTLTYLDGIGPIKPDECYGLFRRFMDSRDLEFVEMNTTIDYAISIDGKNYRINIHKDRGEFGMVIRLVPPIPRTLSDVNLPPVVESFADYKHGLIIITGPTGQGKSTTCAYLINQINEKKSVRINIIEDPLEFIHTDKKALIVHQQVGRDCRSFNDALVSIMRQDPDVIQIGEIRDPDTMLWTLDKAESGHLLITTMHSFGVQAAIDRIINFFPSERQNWVAHQLSFCLRAIISQILVPTEIPGMRVPACEILINTNPIRNIIRDRRIYEIENAIAMAKKEIGMKTMEQGLNDLIRGVFKVKEDTIKGIKEQFGIGRGGKS